MQIYIDSPITDYFCLNLELVRSVHCDTKCDHLCFSLLMLDNWGEMGSTARRPQSEPSRKPVFSLVPVGSVVEGKIKYDN